MGAKNMVIAGNYQGKGISVLGGMPNIVVSFRSSEYIMLDKYEIDTYAILNEKTEISAAGSLVRGTIGAALLGPVGLLAGLTAKNKGIYTIAIRFKDGKQSLIEIDEKIYKAFLKANF